jgi:hypothetical protein
MRSQPNRNYQSNDAVMTPQWLADVVVSTVAPSGVILEPCAGNGAFVRALTPYGRVVTCEASEGNDFFWWSEQVDWVVTNPPWSNFRQFLIHAMRVAEHVVFLATVNHWWTRCRVREVRAAGFGYRQLVLIPWPDEFPASGFQLGAMHLQRAWGGPLAIVHEVSEWNRSTVDRFTGTTGEEHPKRS